MQNNTWHHWAALPRHEQIWKEVKNTDLRRSAPDNAEQHVTVPTSTTQPSKQHDRNSTKDRWTSANNNEQNRAFTNSVWHHRPSPNRIWQCKTVSSNTELHRVALSSIAPQFTPRNSNARYGAAVNCNEYANNHMFNTYAEMQPVLMNTIRT